MPPAATPTEANCTADEHQRATPPLLDAEVGRRTAAIFSALGDPNRLRLLHLLIGREMCVTEIAKALDDNLSAVSQRLKLLRSERVVSYRREGKHVVYSLDDQHITDLITNGIAHADEHRERSVNS